MIRLTPARHCLYLYQIIFVIQQPTFYYLCSETGDMATPFVVSDIFLFMVNMAKHSLMVFCKLFLCCLGENKVNTPGTRGGPGGRDRTLAVNRRKNPQKSFFFVKINKNYLKKIPLKRRHRSVSASVKVIFRQSRLLLKISFLGPPKAGEN